MLKFSEQFVKYNAIKRSSEINVNNIDITTASKGNNPIQSNPITRKRVLSLNGSLVDNIINSVHWSLTADNATHVMSM